MRYKKMRIAAAVLFFVSCFAGAPESEAVTAAPALHTHVRRDGSAVQYRLRGDEFLNYMTDLGGNLVAFGEDGELYIADWVKEQDFLGAGSLSDAAEPGSAARETRFTVPTGRKPAASLMETRNAPSSESGENSSDARVPEYLLEYARQKRTEHDRARGERFGAAARNRAAFTQLSPDAGSDPVERKVLIIYVRFEDESGLENFKTLVPSEQTVYDTVFDAGNFGSVAHYYETVTDGKAKITPAITPAEEKYGTQGDGVVVVTLPGPHKKYGGHVDLIRENIIKPAIEKAADYVVYTDEMSIGVMVHGGEAASGLTNVPNIWAHAHIEKNAFATVNGVGIKSYFACGAFMKNGSGAAFLTSGTIAHELGHDAFGFIDVYDYNESYQDGTASAIGNWSLMGTGNWGKIAGGDIVGSCPSPIDAYNLLYIAEPVVKSGDEEGISIKGPGQIVKLESVVSSSQYFLLQARGYAGYDRGTFGEEWKNTKSGLLIYHVDEAMEKFDRPNDWNAHPLLDIEEAHGGTQHLQVTSGGNGGAPNDLFSAVTKTVFDNTTDPNSKFYNSASTATQGTPSGISVSEIEPDITDAGTEEGIYTAAFSLAVDKSPPPPDEEGSGGGGGGGGGCDTGSLAYLCLAGLPAIAAARIFSRKGKKRRS
jgi:M6 family metalloprotease-like protein